MNNMLDKPIWESGSPEELQSLAETSSFDLAREVLTLRLKNIVLLNKIKSLEKKNK